jgi:hypothetical protein
MVPQEDGPPVRGLVQIIHLHWTKASRGGQGARQRSAVPLAFEVPDDGLLEVDGQLQVEEWHWGERNAFAEPLRHRQRRVAVADGFTFGCVTVAGYAQGLAVRYRWDATHGGAPDRSYLDRGLIVPPGQWVRICSNGRFSDADTGEWYYEQVTVNVACSADGLSGRIFVDAAPAHDLRLLADLW